MILVKRLNSRRLTELFDQLPKSISSFLAVDRIFFKAKNTIIRTFDQLPKSVSSFLAVDRIFFKAKNTIIRTFDQLPKNNRRI
jgi:hypothetical protein